MLSDNKKLIAVIGATGQQGGAVVRALQVFAALFPAAAEVAETFRYFQAHTYLGSDSCDEIALANKISGRQPTRFSTWARVNFPVQTPASVTNK
jgi:hypothetical protein